MSNQVKQVRGQVRQIVKEVLPEVMKQEVGEVLRKEMSAAIKQLEEHVKKQLHEINERHKDTMGYIVRQASSVDPVKKA